MKCLDLTSQSAVRKKSGPPAPIRSGWRYAIRYLVIALAMDVAIGICAGTGLFNQSSVGASSGITCTLEYPKPTETASPGRDKVNPEVVIRNHGRLKLAAISGDVKVYQYHTRLNAITAFARQGLKGVDNLVFREKGRAVDELRHATLVLSGKMVAAVYIINLNYTIVATQEPVHLERLFVVEGRNIVDRQQFEKDSRYRQILQALNGFDDSLDLLEPSGNDPAREDTARPQTAPPPAAAGQTVRPPETVTVQPLFIQVNYVYRAGGTGPLQPIRQGQTLRSGDHYKIYFSPSRDCYVYIYQIDAAGQIFRLFPLVTYNGVALNHDNPVKGGDPITLPSDDRYFYLDQTVGREMLFFAASTQRMAALENLQKEMNIALTSRDAERIEAVRNEITAYLNNPARGRTPSAQVSPITWQTGETTFSVAGYLLEFIDRENIHTVSFNHR